MLTTTKSFVKQFTDQGNTVVEFTKNNGESRVMKCSTNYKELESNEDFIPPKGIKKSSDDYLSVWDLEKNAWRAFRIDKIKKVSFNEEVVFEV